MKVVFSNENNPDYPLTFDQIESVPGLYDANRNDSMVLVGKDFQVFIAASGKRTELAYGIMDARFRMSTKSVTFSN